MPSKQTKAKTPEQIIAEIKALINTLTGEDKLHVVDVVGDWCTDEFNRVSGDDEDEEIDCDEDEDEDD